MAGKRPERKAGPPFEVMNDARPRLRAQRLPLIHLPRLRGADLFITFSFGMDAPQTFCWEDTQNRGVGGGLMGEQEEVTRGTGSVGGSVSWTRTPGWDEPIRLEE